MACVAMGHPQVKVQKKRMWFDALMESASFRLGYGFAVLALGVGLGLYTHKYASAESTVTQDEQVTFIGLQGDESLEDLTDLPWI
jgi:hypothetical protein